MLAGLERLLGEVKVEVRRSCDDDDIDFGVGNQVVGRSVVLERGIVGGRRVVGFRRALDNGVQLEAGSRDDEGDVEDFGREAVGGGLLAVWFEVN
jgi:hypothetical protein